MLFRSHCRTKNWSVLKAGVLPQREMGSIKRGGAAAARIGKYKKRGLQQEMGSIKSGALPQREMGSIKKIGRASCRERV